MLHNKFGPCVASTNSLYSFSIFVPNASQRPIQTKIHRYLAHNLILLNENRNKGENQVAGYKDGTTEAALTWSSRLHFN